MQMLMLWCGFKFIGYVVAKEDPKDMLTKTGQQTHCMSLYLEDLERNKMKCTVFGDMVGKLEVLAARDDVQPLIVVAQLFKPSVYLNEAYIQNTRYLSQVFLNPDFPEVLEFKKSLMAQGEAATQGIAHVESQPQYSVEGELEGGACVITSIEDVMNLIEETSCWILAKIMYRLHLIVADGTGCLNLMMWNDEAKLIIGQSAKEVVDSEKGKSANSLPKAFDSILEKKFLFKLEVSFQNVNSIDYLYSVEKICENEELIAIYASQSPSEIQGMDNSVSAGLAKSTSVEAESQEPSIGIVSLSKDTNSQDQLEDMNESPVKLTAEESVPASGLSGLASPGMNASSNRPPCRTTAKRKFD
ncbi:hypothetical protein PIB30_029902 [Stylosanthes scabra]|uniref:Uncharacterized protein n=1 Tax=Stylosanthes scabra TaxID=79078 RepID=A0ABU6RBM5_9FABA|nr:hypothetical protein [Stylosanthes scabra]